MCESLVYGLELDSMLNLLKAYTYVRLYILIPILRFQYLFIFYTLITLVVR